MLSGDPLLRVIKIMGSRQEVIRMLGISGQRLNAWLNGNVAMGYEYALALEFLTCGQVKADELVPEKSRLLKRLKINLKHPLNWLVRRQIPLSDIKMTTHTNRSFDHLKDLASDIEKQGLLRPILIDSNHILIAGERRLLACESIDKRNIATFILSPEALLNDEDAGYSLKKYFTISERTAIGIALENKIGNRQGQRTDLKLPQNFAEVDTAITTREKVALSIGFNNSETYRQAKKVIQTGIRSLINKMDDEEISVFSAFEISKLPPEAQQKLLSGTQESIKENIRQFKINNELIHKKLFPDCNK